MEIVTYICALLGAFLILVTVHELGHYIVARASGVLVLRFSIGLGPAFWKYEAKNGTEFAFSWFPIGGYVSMLDTREQDEISDDLKHMAFDQVSPLKQIAIAAAGPIANLLLAVVCFWLVSFNGVHVNVPYLDRVETDAPIYQAGLRGGEEIVGIDGEPVSQWFDVFSNVMDRIGDSGTLQIEARSGTQIETYTVPIENWLTDESDPNVLQILGMKQGLMPVVGSILADSAADEIGLLKNDRIVSIDGSPIQVWNDLVDIVQVSADQEISLQVERDGIVFPFVATPQGVVESNGTIRGILGITPLVETRVVAQGVFGGLIYAINKTWEFSAMTVTLLGKMIVGEMSTSNLAGPVSIAHIAGSVAQQGVNEYLQLIALLSISLGLINLLPVPILDGGHIVYGVIELVSGRKLSLRIQRLASYVGMTMVGCLILLALYNDFVRLAGG